MTPKDFSKLIRENKLQGAYLLEGAEEYLKEEALTAVRSALLPPGFEVLNESIMDAPELEDVRDASLAVPFMSEKRLVVVRDAAVFKKKKSSEDSTEDRGQDNDSDQLTQNDEKNASKKRGKEDPSAGILNEILENTPDTAVILFYQQGTAAENAAKKRFADMQRIVSFNAPGETETVAILKAKLKKAEVKADDDALYELLSSCGNSLLRLVTECDKLTAYKGKGGYITTEDVLETVTPDIEKTVFNMIDAVIDGKASQAYTILQSMLERNMRPLDILSMFTRQFRIMAHTKVLCEQGMKPAQIAEKLSIRFESMVSRTYQKIRNVSEEKLIRCYIKSAETEFDCKSGKIGHRQGLDEMMLVMFELSK